MHQWEAVTLHPTCLLSAPPFPSTYSLLNTTCRLPHLDTLLNGDKLQLCAEKKTNKKTLQAFLRAARPPGWTRASLLIVSKRFSKSTWRLRVSPSELFHMSIGKQSWFWGLSYIQSLGLEPPRYISTQRFLFCFWISPERHISTLCFSWCVKAQAYTREVRCGCELGRVWVKPKKKEREKSMKKLNFLIFIFFERPLPSPLSRPRWWWHESERALKLWNPKNSDWWWSDTSRGLFLIFF